MAYKFQIGQSILSGSVTQKGDVTAESSDMFATDISASADLFVGADLAVAGQVDLAASGVSTSIRGGLTVDEDSLFSSDVIVDGTLYARSTAFFEADVTMDADLSVQGVSGTYFAGDIRESVQEVDNGETLAPGYNYFGTLGQAKSVSLPASPVVGDIVKVKAPADCDGTYTITINAQGSHTVDGVASIILESSHAAIEAVYVASNVWKIF